MGPTVVPLCLFCSHPDRLVVASAAYALAERKAFAAYLAPLRRRVVQLKQQDERCLRPAEYSQPRFPRNGAQSYGHIPKRSLKNLPRKNLARFHSWEDKT